MRDRLLGLIPWRHANTREGHLHSARLIMDWAIMAVAVKLLWTGGDILISVWGRENFAARYPETIFVAQTMVVMGIGFLGWSSAALWGESKKG